MLKLLLTTAVSACMSDSQCNSATATEITNSTQPAQEYCCHVNKCVVVESAECQALRYQAYEWLRDNIGTYDET